jgi:hypothetical protein
MSRKEKDLKQRGYKFTGFYSRDKDEAKKEAEVERLNGNWACVLTKVYKGRVYNTEGYSVYVKPKSPQPQTTGTTNAGESNTVTNNEK